MNSSGRAFTVPGNVLLMGEFAVLEEGGLGIALAVERRVRVRIQPGPSLTFKGVWAGTTTDWTPESLSASPLLSACVWVVDKWLHEEAARHAHLQASISIDSSDFFATDGRKTGFGSSASVTVGAVVALLAAAGVPVIDISELAEPLSVAAHRRAQGGIGSGYDVTASLRGGMGIFCGGPSPTWETCALPWGPSLISFAGAHAVHTEHSVRRYNEWKKGNPGPAREFLAASNDAIRSFLAASSAHEAAPWFAESRRLGLSLGEAIGVPASIKPPAGLDPEWCKAMGAGNEMGICLAEEVMSEEHGNPRWQRLLAAREGIRWEE